MRNALEALPLLLEAKEVLDKINVEFWLDYGTLLGAVREGELIPWDNDIDLAAYYSEVFKILKNREKFGEHDLDLTVNLVYGKMWIYRAGIGISIVLYRVAKDCCWNLSPKSRTLLQKLFAFTHLGLSNYRTRKRAIIRNIPSAIRIGLEKLLWVVMLQVGFINLVTVPRHFFEEKTTVNLHGSQFNAPRETEEFLKFRYGKTWRTPNRGSSC